MANPAASRTVASPSLSFPEVIRSRHPRMVFENRLISLLKARLGDLNIIWNPRAFRGGLNNPALPVWLLKKLESLLFLAETVEWKLSRASRDELDATIEDIETFNPPFRKSLARASAALKAGRFVTHRELERQYGIAER